MSTSAELEMAADFAKAGANPMVFKYDTESCIDRGADIAFLSVYQGEKEVLYPPLTYLKLEGMKQEQVAGATMLVISVKTRIVGN